jgi:hypothetical protein
MVVKKKVNLEKEAYLGMAEIEPHLVQEAIDKVREGQDAPLTDDVYPELKRVDNNPLSKLNNVEGRLYEFIEMYQPPLFIDRQKFKRHLLEVLEAWK